MVYYEIIRKPFKINNLEFIDLPEIDDEETAVLSAIFTKNYQVKSFKNNQTKPFKITTKSYRKMVKKKGQNTLLDKAREQFEQAQISSDIANLVEHQEHENNKINF